MSEGDQFLRPLCLTFVPHKWKENICAKCYQSEETHTDFIPKKSLTFTSGRRRKRKGSIIDMIREKNPDLEGSPLSRKGSKRGCGKWKHTEDWNRVSESLIQGEIDLITMQDEITTLMQTTGLISAESCNIIRELVASESCRTNTCADHSDFLVCDKSNLTSLKHISSLAERLNFSQEIQVKVVRAQSAVRRFLAQKRFNEMKQYAVPPLSQRNHFFRDLVKKERLYLFDLDIIVQEFLIPARELTKHKEIGIRFWRSITTSEIDLIFGNIEEIQSFHMKLIEGLELVAESWPKLQGLGRLFLSSMNSFRCYGEYVSNFQVAIETLDNHLSKVDSFTQLCHERAKRLDMELRGLMSAPLNQMSVYELMLDRILQLTPADISPKETQDLEQCLSAFKETNSFILQELEKAENRAKILVAEKRLGKKVELESPGRILMEQVSIELIEKGSGTPHRRGQGELFLFSDKILICRLPSQKKLQLEAFWSLEEVVLDSSGKKGESIGMGLPGGSEFRFFFSGSAEKTAWESLLAKQIRFQTEKDLVFGIDLGVLLARDGNPSPPIPSLVVSVIAHLDNHLQTSGIFRLSGSRAGLKELRAQIDKGMVVDFSTTEIYVVASLLKLFFRSLPEPLLSFAAYQPLISAEEKWTQSGDEDVFANELPSILKPLPIENAYLGKYLFLYLNRVASQGEKNMMFPANLAICFAPNLLRPKEASISAALDVMKVNHIIEYFILHPDCFDSCLL